MNPFLCDQFESFSKEQKYSGHAAKTAVFFENEQLLDESLWKDFVDQFRLQPDGLNMGWRGEFWGKMMRGAVTVYQYTKSEKLYRTMTETVRDMLTVAEKDGRVSSFSRDTEFDAWDVWCRKYVFLGMEYYLEVCEDEELKKEILFFLCRAADYIVLHIGGEEGKKEITSASRSWLGINSSSILEPMVRLYGLTKKREYLDFATYIVENGGADGIDIFQKAYENKEFPYQYGVSKAYEMMSCFEGLLEYYRVTGIEKYKIAAINFGRAVMKSDITVIGTSGCTHELFDHSSARQTVPYDGIMQETCVTVTWMKFCANLLRLTADATFADCMEHSFYNAYLGSLNTQRKECPYIKEKFIEKMKYPRVEEVFLPVDSYSPLRAGKRGQKVGGTQIFSSLRYYGCCTAIAAAGVGVYLGHAVMKDEESIILNFYETGIVETDWNGTPVRIEIKTDYPKEDTVRIRVKTEEKIKFKLKLRIPAWSKMTVVKTVQSNVFEKHYATVSGKWQGEIGVTVKFDMSIRETLPELWDTDVIYTDMSNPKPGSHVASALRVEHDPENDNFVSLSRGPVTLCADSANGKGADTVFSFRKENGKYLCRNVNIDRDCIVACRFESESGDEFDLIDYASAGKDWNTEIAAWLATK